MNAVVIANTSEGLPAILERLREIEVEDALSVPLNRIRPFQNQPRTDFDPNKLEELALSMRTVRQIVPEVYFKKAPNEHSRKIVHSLLLSGARSATQINFMLVEHVD